MTEWMNASFLTKFTYFTLFVFNPAEYETTL